MFSWWLCTLNIIISEDSKFEYYKIFWYYNLISYIFIYSDLWHYGHVKSINLQTIFNLLNFVTYQQVQVKNDKICYFLAVFLLGFALYYSSTHYFFHPRSIMVDYSFITQSLALFQLLVSKLNSILLINRFFHSNSCTCILYFTIFIWFI